MTGEVNAVSYSTINGRTEINLTFTPWDAFFVVFEGTTSQLNVQLPSWKSTSIRAINGSWHVHFQKERGAPEKAVIFDHLTSFSASTDKGIKYFSGTATYMNTFEINSLDKNEKIILDLGDVKNLAEVSINGKNAGTLWKKPFQTDISTHLIVGKNTIEIKVVNSWVNRLVGDMQPGATKIGFTTMPLFKADSPLEPAGLLGPVQLISMKKQ
jgi:flagellin-like hook-associated protein FlgL